MYEINVERNRLIKPGTLLYSPGNYDLAMLIKQVDIDHCVIMLLRCDKVSDEVRNKLVHTITTGHGWQCLP
jgi:hypothetical protein